MSLRSLLLSLRGDDAAFPLSLAQGKLDISALFTGVAVADVADAGVESRARRAAFSNVLPAARAWARRRTSLVKAREAKEDKDEDVVEDKKDDDKDEEDCWLRLSLVTSDCW